ncbi:hypothetical protein RBB50_005609 [Rhinocladiella similis]
MYADDPTFKAAFPGVGDSGGALLETFKGRGLSPRLFVPKDPPKDLRAGDIIISNDGGNANHVFSIVGQEKPIENMRAIQLWGNSGAGTTFYTTLGEFLERAARATTAEGRSYFVLKLDA